MTVENIVPKIVETFTGAGSYPFNFKVYKPKDISVEVVSEEGISTRLILDSDYTVEIVDGIIGGTVDVSYNGPGAVIVILRDLPYVQETVWRNGTPLDMPVLESDFDKTVMLLQQMEVLTREGAIASNWRGDWVSGAEYAPQDLVVAPDTSNWYVAIIRHTSGGNFTDDLAAGLWTLALDVEFLVELTEAAAASAAAAAGSAGNASDSADSAVNAERVALASANFKGKWEDLSGAMSIPASVFYDNAYWMLVANISDIGSEIPGISSAWELIRVGALPDATAYFYGSM